MHFYGISGYGQLILDTSRTGAYADALRAVVRTDSAVLDIGTGTGILAFLACRFGARKVYALEPGSVIELARQAAQANGFADRIEFIQKMSTAVDLAEKVDVIVSDVHGVLPLWETSMASIKDARERFLSPGGHLIPRKETLWAALVEAPESYREVVEPWDSKGYKFDFRAVRNVAVNNFRKLRPNSCTLISEPRCWATLDYRTLSDTNVGGQITWRMDRAATAHGLALWFDSELFDGIGFSNSPHSPTRQLFGQAFFPWTQPVALSPGDEVSVQLRADFAGEQYVWTWNTKITRGAGEPQTTTTFRQSTFLGTPISLEDLRKRAQTFVPRLDEDGCIDRMVLNQMAEELPLVEIARNLTGKFPHRFSTLPDALERVANLSSKYSL